MNKETNKWAKGLMLLTAALLIPIVTMCSTPAEAGENYLSMTLASYHFDRSKDHNEQNFGLGYERKFNDDWRLGVGFYKNSFYRHTNYVFGSYTPFDVGGFRVGAVAGLASGYTPERLDPLLGLFVTRELEIFGERLFGVNLLIHPAAVALQVKVPF